MRFAGGHHSNLRSARLQRRIETQYKENIVMTTTINRFITIHVMKQANRLLPALMTLALVTAIFGVTGCTPPHH